MGSRQFHYTESSCFSSGSRPLCRLPSTENWKHGTNNIMCYSNFAPGLVICPSAVTSVADRADVPASLPVFPRLLSLKLSRLHDRSAIVSLSANYFCHLKKKRFFQYCYAFYLDVKCSLARFSLQCALWLHSSMIISVIAINSVVQSGSNQFRVHTNACVQDRTCTDGAIGEVQPFGACLFYYSFITDMFTDFKHWNNRFVVIIFNSALSFSLKLICSNGF